MRVGEGLNLGPVPQAARRRTSEAEFDAHLIKPVELASLINLLEQLPR
ncbi:hypothetical protein [Ramlibacter sp. WS9]|nr:hypothetical protein [Ramlibacter sp. WS9]